MNPGNEVSVPAGPVGASASKDDEGVVPFVAWVDLFGRDADARDVTKPLGFDERGQPVYAPLGLRRRIF